MALKQLGVPTELFMYPGSTHGIPDPRNQLVKSVSEMAWMDYYVRGTESAREVRRPLARRAEDARDAAGVRYVLIGGFAVILHGFVRTTKDIDLLVDPSADNVRAVRRGLAALPDNAAAELQDDDVDRYGVVRVADEIVVDLMGRACGLTYRDAVSAGVDTFDIDGVAIPAATKSFLIRTKETVRDHDKLDVRYLQMRIAEESR
jgi:hypothetical protein